MKIRNIIKGFTLIELLVVITIIGILATGATAVYTSQIQKARDSTRITDLEALKSAAEQVYQDSSEYPHATSFVEWAAGLWMTWMKEYLANLPRDPKHGQSCSNGGTAFTVDCAYAYVSGVDANGIAFWEYEISTAFENNWNITSRAWKDTWADPLRLEMWVDTLNNDTVTAAATITPQIWACTAAWAASVLDTDIII